MSNRFKYIILSILAIAAFLIWLALFEQAGQNVLTVVFFDVGEGDSVFIETPTNQQILIDGGPDLMVMEKLAQEMPFFDKSIDLIVSTHPDSDHLTGLVEVLKYYKAGGIITSNISKNSNVYEQWQNFIREKDIPIVIAQAGQTIDLGNGVVLKVFWPDQGAKELFSKKTNDGSVVLQLIYGQKEFLLTGDIERGIELKIDDLFGGNLASDVLKLAHHGSKTSSSQFFLDEVKPQIVVISVGAKNTYGHPAPSVLEGVKNLKILRTDLNGDIKLITNGIDLEVKTEK